MTPQKQPQPAALRAGAAATYLGIGVSTIWQKAREEANFPKPRKMSARTTVWLREDLDAYLASLAPSTETEEVFA
ncbi:helix-turn-helix transcriptional regulator [Achromobacter spanius]|uniref:helix-turn-helix transcriptional regulator n=1 Tax=Achromobacter spanius TaxID=217203 RepID=UPI003F68E803